MPHANSRINLVENTVLYETPNFVVVPTLGALVEGWVLIISKEHHLCMAALPPDCQKEFISLSRFVAEVIGENYGPATLFEHGPASHGLTIGCGVDHAHLHVLPLAFSLKERASKSDVLRNVEWAKAPDGLADVSDIHSAGESYLYVAEPNVTPEFCAVRQLPGQFLRRVISAEVGCPDRYDYGQWHHTDNIKGTVDKLSLPFSTREGSTGQTVCTP